MAEAARGAWSCSAHGASVSGRFCPLLLITHSSLPSLIRSLYCVLGKYCNYSVLRNDVISPHKQNTHGNKQIGKKRRVGGGKKSVVHEILGVEATINKTWKKGKAQPSPLRRSVGGCGLCAQNEILHSIN